jgi:hypothetical protein
VGQAGETTAAAAAIVSEESSWVCGVGGARAPPDCSVAVPAVVVVTGGEERDNVAVPSNLFLLRFTNSFFYFPSSLFMMVLLATLNIMKSIVNSSLPSDLLNNYTPDLVDTIKSQGHDSCQDSIL